jgi:hypothetical protein
MYKDNKTGSQGSEIFKIYLGTLKLHLRNGKVSEDQSIFKISINLTSLIIKTFCTLKFFNRAYGSSLTVADPCLFSQKSGLYSKF